MKKIISLFLVMTMLLGVPVCFAQSSEAKALVFEAENGTFSSGLKVYTDMEGYSGTGYVGRFSADDLTLDIPVSVSEDGRYNITVRTNSNGNYKENFCYIDGVTVGRVYSYEQTGWQDYTFEAVKLTKGDHTLTIKEEWGWIYVDCVIIEKGEGIPDAIYDIDYELINPNANASAKRLWKYLCDNYGKNIISGQYTDKGQYSAEYSAILEATGEAPAIWGFDMMDYSPSRVRYGAKPKSVDYAIQWAKEYGGIVTFCWHWTPHEDYLYGNTVGKEWWRGFYTHSTNIDFKAVMNGEDESGYNYILEDIDAIAKELKRLQDEGIAVLWRPLHEASGGWFWWGTDKDSYLKLWKLMYDRLTNYHELNNLIWVWNGQNADWYPGDEYCDIIGEDIYADNHDTSSQMARFLKAKNYTNPPKMLCLSENGVIPDVDNCIEDNAMWSWFATWGGEYTQKNGTLSGSYTPTETYIKVYQSDKVITLSELPDLFTYPIEEDNEYSGGGDFNQDGKVNITDVVLARAHIVNMKLIDDAIIEKEDPNGDGKINIVDVVLIRSYIVNNEA